MRLNGCTSSRSAAPRSAPDSTPIRSSARRRHGTSRRKPASRSSGRAITVAALSAHDAMAAASGALRTLAGGADEDGERRALYASGPRAGIGELRIPENEPGSSIMPGKINPTQCEALTMVAVQVFGNDLAVALAGSQGHFQLNVYKPVILHNVLESVELLADACRSFDQHCARGIEPNLDRIRAARRGVADARHRAQSAHRLREGGGDRAEGAPRAPSLRDAAIGSGFVTAEQFADWVKPEKMARPHGGA